MQSAGGTGQIADSGGGIRRRRSAADHAEAEGSAEN
jgi:hypothetical protein